MEASAEMGEWVYAMLIVLARRRALHLAPPPPPARAALACGLGAGAPRAGPDGRLRALRSGAGLAAA